MKVKVTIFKKSFNYFFSRPLLCTVHGLCGQHGVVTLLGIDRVTF